MHLDLEHPNPHFPAPPRPVRRLGCLGAILVLAAAIVVLAVMVWLGDNVPFGVVFALLLLGFGMVVGSVLLANDRLSAAPWIEGQILPARVLIAPKGPHASLVWFLFDFIPGVGLIAGLVSSHISASRNLVHVLWQRDGVVETVVLHAERHWKFYRDNLDIWACVGRKGKLVPLHDIAPRHHHQRAVPSDVVRFLDSITPTELQPLVDARKAELFEFAAKRAAKANVKAAKQTARYEKRVT
jgi:hypothetical protein